MKWRNKISKSDSKMARKTANHHVSHFLVCLCVVFLQSCYSKWPHLHPCRTGDSRDDTAQVRGVCVCVHVCACVRACAYMCAHVCCMLFHV